MLVTYQNYTKMHGQKNIKWKVAVQIKISVIMGVVEDGLPKLKKPHETTQSERTYL